MTIVLQHRIPEEGFAEEPDASNTQVSVEAKNARMAELELIEAAITASDVAVFCWDVASETVSVAGAWRKVMGVGADEDVDYLDDWIARIHPEDLQEINSAYQECIDGRTPRMRVEYRLRERDGQGWTWMCSDAVVSERDGKGNAIKLM